MDIFSIVPIEVAADDRLTKTDLRVLCAIFSFRGKDTHLIRPEPAHIAQRCRLHLAKVNEALVHLEELGLLDTIWSTG